ncbi:MAG: hypothetical protein OXK72_02365 [Gammaproteobacteria bacterium]|nr:hypothetical protein [Gammaproteobacteria bacterium]
MSKWYQDSDGNTSSMRIMSMMALAGGLIAMFVQLFGYAKCDVDLELVLLALFGGALGGKAYQSRGGK